MRLRDLGILQKAGLALAFSAFTCSGSVEQDSANSGPCPPFSAANPQEVGFGVHRGSVLSNETPAFRLSIPAGQLAHAEVSSRDVDLALCLYSPQGKLLIEQDGLWSVWEKETILWRSEHAEDLTLVIQTVAPMGPGRRFDLRAELVPQPTKRDLQTTRALSMLARADFALRRENPRAEPLLTQVLKLWQRLGRADKTAEVQFRLGTLRETTEPQLAEGYFLSALRGFASEGQKYPRAWTLQKLAQSEERLGRRVESVEHLELARRDFESLGARPETAEVLEAQARLARLLGQSDRELQLFQAAAIMWRGLDRPTREAEAILNQGQVLARWGRYHEALERYDLAGSRKTVMDELGLAARIQTARGKALARLGKAALAKTELEAALDLWGRTADIGGSVAALTGLCFAMRQLGQLKEAYAVCQRALKVSQDVGPPDYAARTRYSVGLSLRDAGRHREALTLFEQSRDEARSLSDRDLEAASLMAEARSERAMGKIEIASDRAAQAIGVLESARLGSDVLELRTSFLGDRAGYYDLAVNLHLELADRGNYSKELRSAFEIDERYRARGLLDLVMAGRKHVADTKSRTLRNIEASLTTAIENSDRTDASEQGLSEAWRQYSLQVREVTAADPIGSRGLASLEEIQKLLDPETVVLQVRLRETRSLCWTITRDDLRITQLPAAENLSELGKRALLTLASPPAFAKGDAYALAKLSRELLGPLAVPLRHRSRLVVVADGFLQAFPWSALIDPEPLENGRSVPLLERFEIIQVPSSSLLVALAKRRRPMNLGPREILALGNPLFAKPEGQGPRWSDLPATESEVRALEAAAGSHARVTSALGASASRQTLLNADWPHISILHLATHAEVDGQFPYLSRLALAEKDSRGQSVEGSFFAFEALQLPLKADLVVLSGCQTAQGEIVPGEGLIGLSYAFLAAGADRVLASLWPVADAPTAELISSFYRHLLGAGQSEATALREAQRELRLRGEPAYVWASFILQGRLPVPGKISKQIIGHRAPSRSEPHQRGSNPMEARRNEITIALSRRPRTFGTSGPTRGGR